LEELEVVVGDRKELGKISSARFGWGGYQDAMLGLSLTFTMKGAGVNTFVGAWGIDRSEYAKWTEADRLTQLGEAVMKLGKMLSTAHKTDVSELVGVPVELSFDGNLLKDWRLLDEVL
jgi:hypothetical protein